ncbi:AraC family transcriptional regulator [Roseateles paludis]|uniref:AraC family transcriptional regulator n=1 Tax=Roseateles paludis TaxID=3145238 RepID=A0ABV0FZM5_9BURK
MNPPAPDPFDDALADLRLSGTVLLSCCYPAPWAVDVPSEDALRRWLGAPAQARVMVFHCARSGSFELQRSTGEVVTAAPGEVVVVPAGEPHRLGRDASGSTPLARLRGVPLQDVLAGQGPAKVPLGTPGSTGLLCGAFIARATPLNPLLGSLPPLLHAQGAEVQQLSYVLARLAQCLDEGEGARFRATRLLELLCAELLHLQQQRPGGTGWLAGLSDTRLGPALRLLHAKPHAPLSVPRLAAAAALSPSRFAARFRELMGCSVMQYATEWRMNLACRLLADDGLSLGETAQRVGYENLPAFSRSFKARVGVAPGAWRAQQRGVVG